MKRLLAVGIIFLLVGMGIPSTSTLVEKSPVEKGLGDSLPLDINGTEGENGWYITPVTVSINTSHVDEFWYSINGRPWTLYTEPFVIDGEGRNIIHYYWIIYGRRFNATVPAMIKIDYTLPVLSLIKPELGRLYLFGFRLFRIGRDTPLMIGKSTIKASAYDKVSGTHNVTFMSAMENETTNTFVDESAPYYEWRLEGKYIGTYNLTVEVKDWAGLTRNIACDVEIIQYGFL